MVGEVKYEDGCICTASKAFASKDPWIDRNSGMRCRTCIWFVEKTKADYKIGEFKIGRCRRHAPTMNGYPVVYENDWCGDHRVDENK